jgi:hypothetical protein
MSEAALIIQNITKRLGDGEMKATQAAQLDFGTGLRLFELYQESAKGMRRNFLRPGEIDEARIRAMREKESELASRLSVESAFDGNDTAARGGP